MSPGNDLILSNPWDPTFEVGLQQPSESSILRCGERPDCDVLSMARHSGDRELASRCFIAYDAVAVVDVMGNDGYVCE